VILLGEIVRLQVQRSTLKLAAEVGAAYPQRYEPAPLVDVAALLLTSGGVIGVLDSGEHVLDVHHLEHPDTKNHERSNDLSLGFTSHYAAMRERFGAHIMDGIAGENVLIGCNAPVGLHQLTGGAVIETSDGVGVRLERLAVAEPCVPFTRFSLCLGPSDPSGERVTEALRFLREGRRGFYASYAGGTVLLRAGDRVLGLEPGSAGALSGTG
jgi:hypothetical protein